MTTPEPMSKPVDPRDLMTPEQREWFNKHVFIQTPEQMAQPVVFARFEEEVPKPVELAALIAGDGITTREQAGVAADAVIAAGWVSRDEHAETVRVFREQHDFDVKRAEQAEAAHVAALERAEKAEAVIARVETLAKQWEDDNRWLAAKRLSAALAEPVTP